MSDRALRDILLGEETGRWPGKFVITEASEVMAVLALPTDHADLRQRLGTILVGLTEGGQMVRAEEFGCAGSMAVLLKDALLPNLVQTVEGLRHSFMPDRSATSRTGTVRLSPIGWHYVAQTMW